QRPGHDRYQGASVVEVMKVSRGDDGRAGRRQMVQTLDAHVDPPGGEAARPADGVIRDPGC
ncbi:MAG: hypothetical protein K0S99_3086, partial [Thermomicrobiales bacterium]|nr:hypothetical protein [Thermomicrobiales bacterium]